MTDHASLTALSPLDGRYLNQSLVLQKYFSEYALIHNRVRVEIEWLIALANHSGIAEVPEFNDDELAYLKDIALKFTVDEALKVKAHEATTNHDVKAVEYYLKDRLLAHKTLAKTVEFIHFGCTSEDINNLAYALSLAEVRPLLVEHLSSVQTLLKQFANKFSAIPMLSKTHGQSASPTTVGKEFANVHERLKRQVNGLEQVIVLGKMNGAVGNFNAHLCAYPEVDWDQMSASFIAGLGLTDNPYTTQIEPHDYCAEYFHALCRINTVLIDLSRDIWGYISFAYFRQKTKAGEVGSSTMPHKVNPIDFENAEGNLGMANALLSHFAEKLPISRFQRDLSDSTVQRNIGMAIGYSLVAWTSLKKGLNKLQVNHSALQTDLDNNPEVLAEAVQTVMRRYGIEKPYEKLKSLTRGQRITLDNLHQFIQTLDIPNDAKQRLLQLKPDNYLGNAKNKSDII